MKELSPIWDLGCRVDLPEHSSSSSRTYSRNQDV